MADKKKTTKKKAATKKATPKPSAAKKEAVATAPVSHSSAGTASRMSIKQYVRFRPDRSWAVPLAARADQKTLGEWDAWYQAVLSSPAK